MNNSVIITGANRGIGSATVETFANSGYKIIWACARKKNDDFENRLKLLAEKTGATIKPVYFDLANEEAIKQAVKEIRSEKIPVDALVNVAGVVNTDTFLMTPISKIREVFETNYFGTITLTQYILKIMIKQKSGSIINFSSIAGIDANPTNCTYGSSKAAIIAFTRTLASEVGELGVRVNAVAPGPTDTDMIVQVKNKVGDAVLSNCAMNRYAKPKEIANVALFLASEQASFINGQVIRVDGGSK